MQIEYFTMNVPSFITWLSASKNVEVHKITPLDSNSDTLYEVHIEDAYYIIKPRLSYNEHADEYDIQVDVKQPIDAIDMILEFGKLYERTYPHTQVWFNIVIDYKGEIL